METPHGFSNLGGQAYVEDGTEYTLKLGSAGAIPATYMPPEFFQRPKVFYQRQIPDCGANAGAFQAAYLDEHPDQIYSPDYQWVDIKSLDGLPLGVGTDMKSIFKSLTKGSIPYAMLPEQTTLPLALFSSPNRLTAEMKAEAANHTISAYGFHNDVLSMSVLKNLIYTHKAILVLVQIGDEFWTRPDGVNSWQEQDILPLRSPELVVSGHFIVLGAFDENQIYFANWWSEDWGRNGYGYFKDNYVKQIRQVGTIVDSIDAVVIPQFKKDLYLGMTDPDVSNLQKYLNSHGYTVATTGPGSPGNETNYFGGLTQAAVRKMQIANGITPSAGYFGIKSRAFVNSHA